MSQRQLHHRGVVGKKLAANRSTERKLAEIGLTLIFLTTLRDWLRDESEEQFRTRRNLRRRLESADRRLA